jgi:hypothetical protein
MVIFRLKTLTKYCVIADPLPLRPCIRHTLLNKSNAHRVRTYIQRSDVRWVLQSERSGNDVSRDYFALPKPTCSTRPQCVR